MEIIHKKPVWLTAITTLSFIVVIIFAATSCNKTENPVELYSSVVTNIEVKVENATEYSNVVEVKLMVIDRNIGKYIELASGEWKDGGFTIVLPNKLDPNFLSTLFNNNRVPMPIINPPSTVTINNKNVQVCYAYFFGFDKDGNAVNYFYPAEIDKDGNVQDAFFTYADSEVTISGSAERRKDSFISTQHDWVRNQGCILMFIQWNKINTIYSLKWEEGWNVWSLYRFAVSGSTATEKWSPPISNLKWYGVSWKIPGYFD